MFIHRDLTLKKLNATAAEVCGTMFDGDTRALDKAYQGQPVQRIGQPEEIARMALFLLGDEASYVCGAEMVVDGGNLAGRYFEGLPGAPETSTT